MIEHVKETSAEAEDREGGRTDVESDQAEAEAQCDDPDVLDAAVREETLEIVLGQREEDAEHAGRDPHADQQPPCPRRERTEEREGPDESVDPRLDHHTGHHRRDVRRRRGVCLRQPDMERHEARLRPEADHGEDEQEPDPRGRREAVEIE